MTRFDKLHALVDRHRGEIPNDEIASGRAAFIAAVDQPRRQPSISYAWPLAAAMLAVVLGMSGYWLTRSRKTEIAITSPHAGTASSVRLELSALGPASLELTEGVTAELSARTLAYRTEQAPGEHRVTLEKGRLRLSIDPARHMHWTVLAGGYEVSVVGTIFSVERLLDGAEIDVKVERGRVSVSGGSLGSERVMVDAGHQLRGRPAGFAVTDLTADSPPLPSPEGSGVVETERSPAAGASPATDDVAFIARYRMRDYRGALEAAERSGFSGLLERLDRKSLAQLADAARLAGNVARARQALTRLRERFPASTEATDAAFLLGRLYADSLSDAAGAARYFDLYLTERPEGAYADEAEGRSMVTHREAGDIARARQVASHYLARFPSGPYASTARSILR
jgi:TolA-binding protein